MTASPSSRLHIRMRGEGGGHNKTYAVAVQGRN